MSLSTSTLFEGQRAGVPNEEPFALSLRSTQEFLSFIDEGRPNRLKVVKYYANYCKVCQRTRLIYLRMAKVESDPNLEFATVEISALGGGSIAKSLGVTKTPFIQIYRNGSCVASFSTGPAHNFSRKAGATLDLCKSRTDEEWEIFLDEFKENILEQEQAIDALRHPQSTDICNKNL
jgi:thiol-disulfide isomerase/thioredoxin